MSVDLSKLIFASNVDAFKNNNIYTGSFNLSGTVTAGTSVRSQNIFLNENPDLVSIVFNGPTDTVSGLDPRPSDGWFRQGAVWVIGNGGTVSNYPTMWQLYGSISGLILTITAVYVQTFVDTVTLDVTPVFYRVVDYSVA